MAAASDSSCKVALCQMTVVEDKATNIAHAREMVKRAVDSGAALVVLPEVFNGPYDTTKFASFAEPVPEVGGAVDEAASPTLAMLAATAKEHGVFLVGGSVAELGQPASEGAAPAVFNTCTVWSPAGELIAKHRKMHLFDIDVPGRITFKESDSLTAGSGLAAFDTPFGRVGVGICYDLRFPQLSALLRHKEDCSVLVFPGAFNTTTGPAHWELLLRARALDNQVFVCACSPARNPDAGYQAYGHSMVVDPWGAVVATTEHDEAIVLADMNVPRAAEVRTNIPISKQVRTDLYTDVEWKGPGRA
ncbi:hypothetical protein FNF29_01845 [Cafeteria roenbergensis]|uniref:CN hydrolase domain-containing protein n=1 Tax=Cafeteria roenbergensis TaxID=33653 RepID=A0A5A8CQV1_CAFRO|nr:hypothetical protein FNF29_01845 [Cafeteria roenbergensis]|eukprot:KAA0155472.1 hypothetical protein FNF29_01845 [Cafeteria roenbergensis]